MKFWPQRIRHQILLLTGLFTAIIGLLTTWHGKYAQYENLANTEVKHMSAVSKSLALTIESQNALQNLSQIHTLLKNTIEIPGITELTIVDAKGAIIASVERDLAQVRTLGPNHKLRRPPRVQNSLAHRNENNIIVWQKIFSENTHHWLLVSYSLQSSQTNVNHLLIKSLFIQALLILGGLGALFLFLHPIFRGLEQTTDFARNILQNLGSKMTVQFRSFELVDLANSLNQASEQLSLQQQEMNEIIDDIINKRNELNRLASFPKNAPSLVMSFNSRGELVYFNPAADKIANRLNLDLKNTESWLPVELKNAILKCSWLGTNVESLELTFMKRTWICSLNAVALDNIVDAYAVDVTDLKTAEARERQALIDKLQAESANSAKSDFLAQMTHEIRTPLTAIIGFSDSLLSNEVQKHEIQSSLEVINRNGRHLLSMINNILDLSKIEANMFELSPTNISIGDLIEDIEYLVKPTAEEKGLAFNLSYDHPLPKEIFADRVRLRQMVLNICANAIKFTAEGHINVHLSADYKSHRLFISVRDTGVGISPSDLNRIFSAFEQVQQANLNVTGTGLGLSISRKIAQMMNGNISAESKLGQGSAFTIDIDVGPLNEDHVYVKQESLEPTTELQPQLSAPIERQGKILLVEDNVDNQRLISIYLRRAGGEVDICPNGEEALVALRSETYDLILMDMRMPKMDGVTATRQLRQLGISTPVVILTANAFEEDVNRCYQAGANAFLSKPIVKEKLLALLERYLPHKQDQNELSDKPMISTVLKDEPYLQEVVEKYVAALPSIFSDIEQAYRENNLDRLEDLLHDLKGTGGGNGYPEISEIAVELREKIIDQNQLETTRILQRIKSIINRVQLGLKVA